MPKQVVSGWGFPWKGNSIQGGGSYGVFTSQSIQGGGAVGVFASQSIQGGGSVSGIPTRFTTGGTGQQGGTFGGFFVKVASFPASDMTLFDFNGASTVYLRGKMTSTGHVVLETSFNGHVTNVDLTPVSGISASTLYWVGFVVTSVSGTNVVFRLKGQVIGPGGGSEGIKSADVNYGSQSGVFTPTCILGWGVSETTSYLNFPNSANNELSKFESGTNNSDDVPIPGVPTSDVGTGGLNVLYLCRDSLGSHATIVDSTANHFDLTAGPNGLIVVTDGPYP